MSWIEHTPHTEEMRETAVPPLSPDVPEKLPEAPVEASATEASQAAGSKQPHETHTYTYPNRETGYQQSGLYRDIMNNPALYMDRADF